MCNESRGGVDLNRNYGFMFGEGASKGYECEGDTYRGPHSFSEPETIAMRDFLTSKQKELKFVYNFHCAGKQFVIPYSGMFPNSLSQENPSMMKIFNEIVIEA